jgi:FAD/FMN-containing dehydrogenase
VTTTTGTSLSLRQLRAALAGAVITPDDAAYDDARKVFFPAFDRQPAAIVRPVDADDVATVVAFARSIGLELAVRSGGHSPAGHGTSEGGIVIDLSAMNALELDPDRRVVHAETGLKAGEVTAATADHGLAVGFGDNGSVGIGGLTLGGGVGYLVRKHGLTIDSLLAAEIVTADGRLLYADAEQHPDLFWAIRGGGGNFGVATRFLYRLHPIATVTGGMLVLPATPETIAGFVAAADEAPDELSTIANVMPGAPLPFLPDYARSGLVLMATLAHAGPVEEGARAVAPFRELAAPIADTIRPMLYSELFPSENGIHPPRVAGRTLFIDSVDHDDAASILDGLRRSTAMMASVQLRVLGGAVARVSTKATAFAHRASRIMVNVGAVYANPDDAPLHEAWVDVVAGSLRQEDGGAYVNFLGDEGEQRVRAAYPGSTWDRLRAVKRRYDPENLFRLNQNIPPAASEGEAP